MKHNKALSLFFSLVLIVSSILPCFQLTVGAIGDDAVLSGAIEDIKTAWGQVQETAFVACRVKPTSSSSWQDAVLTANTSADDIKYFDEQSLILYKDTTWKNQYTLMRDAVEKTEVDYFTKKPLDEIKDVCVYAKTNKSGVSVKLSFKITFKGTNASGSTEEKPLVVEFASSKALTPNEYTLISGLPEGSDFKTCIEQKIQTLYSADFYGWENVVAAEFTEVRFNVTQLDTNFTGANDAYLQLGSAYVVGGPKIPEEFDTTEKAAFSLLPIYIREAEKVMADTTYKNKENLQAAIDNGKALLDSFDVNLAERTTISAYITQSDNRIDAPNFDYGKQVMLYDGDLNNPVIFNTNGNKLDILVNLEKTVTLSEFNVHLLNNNVNKLKIYGSNQYSGIWSEESFIWEYDASSVSTVTDTISKILDTPAQYQYVRFSFESINGTAVNITEIQCVGDNVQKSEYKNLILDKKDIMTVAEVNRNTDSYTILDPTTYGKFGDTIYNFKDKNVVSDADFFNDGDLSTTYDLVGGSNDPAKKLTYNIVFNLNERCSIDNIKFISGSNKEYFPTKVNYYVGSSLNSVLRNNATCVATFNSAPDDGVYNADFTPQNATFVRIEIAENTNQVMKWYGEQLVTVVADISISGSAFIPELTVDTTSFNKTSVTKYSTVNNISQGLTPAVYLTRTNNSTTSSYVSGGGQVRSKIESDVISHWSNGDIGQKGLEIKYPFYNTSAAAGTGYVNGYTPDVDYDFANANIDTYADIIYDLGVTANINKLQHFGANNATLSMGLYQVYASNSLDNLFNQESFILNYQNKKSGTSYNNGEEHVLSRPISARFVAFRVLAPSNWSDDSSATYFNNLRIGELAIYGTKNNSSGYTVADINPPTAGDLTVTAPTGTTSLLSTDNLTIKGYVNGTLNSTSTSNSSYVKWNNGYYGYYGNNGSNTGSHTSFSGVTFNNNNGYVIDRSDVSGNITFEKGDVTNWVELSYDLGGNYKIDSFNLYSYYYENEFRIQAYEVYLADSEADLYNQDNLIAKYDNYFNAYGQVFKFADATKNITGRYLGVKVVLPGYATADNYIRLTEIAAFGVPVSEATANAPEITSNSVFIYHKDNSSIFTSGGQQRTAVRMTVGYHSPIGDDGLPQADKIILADGSIATVIERNVIATPYNSANASLYTEQSFNETTTGVTVTSASGEKLNKYFKSEKTDTDTADTTTVFGSFNLNNLTKAHTTLPFVVRGRVVYQTSDGIYVAYSDITGEDGQLNTQIAYDALCNIVNPNNITGNNPIWFD